MLQDENAEPANNAIDQTGAAEQNETNETGETGEEEPTGDKEAPEKADLGNPQNVMPGAAVPNPMGFGMNPAMFPNMAWGANPMAQFMGNGMMGFPNPMGMCQAVLVRAVY